LAEPSKRMSTNPGSLKARISPPFWVALVGSEDNVFQMDSQHVLNLAQGLPSCVRILVCGCRFEPVAREVLGVRSYSQPTDNVSLHIGWWTAVL
jgi:hypothetical protein